MANPQTVNTLSPFTPEVDTKQARNKAIIRFSRFRPIGRVFSIRAVKADHPLTIPSLSMSGLPGHRTRASAFVNSLWLGLITLGINIINPPTSPR